MTPTKTSQRPRRATRAVVRAALSGALVLGLALVAPGAGAAPAARKNDNVPTTEPGVRMVHANIKTGMSAARFNADLASVYGQAPDVVTFNEVHRKTDAEITPAGSGYQLWRDNGNRYRGETPVAWRTDRWSPVAQGNRMLSNWRGVPPGKQVELGRRFANWVTLTSDDGRVLSVVSVHLAPQTKGMPDLRRPGVERLVKLVDELAAKGPVLVGGDFNVAYRSKIYPRDLFDLGKLVPTYDTLGTSFPTGDHFGATIDYVFNRGEGQLLATAHQPVELKSDHDAVVADFAWQVDAPTQVAVVSNAPRGNAAAKQRSAQELVNSLDAVPRGGKVQVFSADLRQPAVQAALRSAASRRVSVRYMTRSTTLTPRERGLARHFASLGKRPTSAVVTCDKACRDAWRASGLPKGVVLVTTSKGGQPSVRLDVSRNLNGRIVKDATSVVRYTGPRALEEAVRLMPSF